jgi:hypothetical protein
VRIRWSRGGALDDVAGFVVGVVGPIQCDIGFRRSGPEAGGGVEIVELGEERPSAGLADDGGHVFAVVVVAVDLAVRRSARTAAVDAGAAAGGDAAVGERGHRPATAIDLHVVEVEEIARAGGAGRALVQTTPRCTGSLLVALTVTHVAPPSYVVAM